MSLGGAAVSLRDAIVHAICSRLARNLESRTIDQPGNVRYKIFGRMNGKGSGISLYLHHITEPDNDERGLHNHPWSWAISWILSGAYEEDQIVQRHLWSHGFRRFDNEMFHRITDVWGPCWTLFLAGPRSGEGWGFIDPEIEDYDSI